MTRKDFYYNKAKQEGYRSRAAYKLKQLDDSERLLKEGATVVDLGAAPGGWLQVAAASVGPSGTVIGVDFQRIDSLDDVPATVETIRGDMTDDQTKATITSLVGEADVVLSDMAPNMTGEYSLDHARSVHLARQAFEVAIQLLTVGGHLVVKVFDGPDLDALRRQMERKFEYVRTTTPAASRKESSEVYLIAKKFHNAPVTEGDMLTVTIETIGTEGDGIAKIEGYTLFVPDTEPGETLDVIVTDVKARFGFASVEP